MIPTPNLNLVPSLERLRDAIAYYGCKIHSESVEAQEVGAESSYTVCELSGYGVVVALWNATGNMDIRLRVFVDGEEDPSIDVDLGLLGGHFHQGHPGQFGTKHILGGGSIGGQTCTILFPIPYRDGCKVEFYNPSPGTAVVYCCVYYVDDFTYPFRLRSVCKPWIDKFTGISNPQDVILLDVEGTGWVVWHSMLMDGADNDSYLESDLHVFVDGEAEPSINATGTEDWFLSGWYFHGQVFSSPVMFCSLRDETEYRTLAALDLLAVFGGLRFLSSVEIVWKYDEAWTTCDMGYVILWYERI